MYRLRPNGLVRPKNQDSPKECRRSTHTTAPPPSRRSICRLRGAHAQPRRAATRPEFLEIAITMPQAKLLYLVARRASSTCPTSSRAGRLAVDGERPRRQARRPRPRDPPRRPRRPAPGRRRADARRHGAPGPLPRAQRRQMRDAARGLETRDSTTSAARPPRPRAARATRRRPQRAAARGAHVHAKGPRMSRLSQLAVAKRSVTLLLAGALFIAGILAWGTLKQELLPDIEFPVITVIAPLPGRRRRRRRRPGHQADRARDLGRAAPRGAPVDLRQLDRARRRAVRVRHRRQGDRARAIEQNIAGRGPPGDRRARRSPRSTSTPRP